MKKNHPLAPAILSPGQQRWPRRLALVLFCLLPALSVAPSHAADAPVITQQPQSQTAAQGMTVAFSVVAEGAAPLMYQWYFNGMMLAGGTGASYTLWNVGEPNSGAYVVVVMNPYGSVTSQVATLTVISALVGALDGANLAWTTGGSAPWFAETGITHDGVDAAQSGRVLEGRESWLQTTVTGPGTVAFWWKVSSEMDADYLEFYLGGVRQSRISGVQGWEQLFFAVPAGTQTLRWRYAKDIGTDLNQDSGWLDQVSFQAYAGAPAILAEPLSQRAGLADTVVFVVGAIGELPLRYQWWRDETNLIAGATNAAFSLTNVTWADSGNFSVLVSNSLGTALSRGAALQLTTNSAVTTILLLSSNCVNCSNPYQPALTNLGRTYQWFNNNTAFGQVVAGADPATTLVVVDAPAGNYSLNSVAAFARAGGRVLLEYWGLAEGSPLAAALDATVVSALSSTTDYVYDWGRSSFFAGVPSMLPVWPAGYDTHGQLLEALPGGLAVAGHAFNTNYYADHATIVIGRSGRTVINSFLLEEAGDYLRTEATRLAQNELEFLLRPTLPQIALQPQDRTVALGSNAMFTVMAAGAWPLFYQWTFNGTNLPGTGQATLTIPGVGSNQVGSYLVVVTNAYGSATSQVAVLAVATFPQIITQPQSQTVAVGSNATFSVEAAGIGPLRFQWFFNETTTLAGATNATYTIAQAQLSQAGRYSVRVTNALGSVTSSEAVLTLETMKPVSRVLLFADGAWPSAFQTALTNLGLSHQIFLNETTFAQAVGAASWLDTLVIVDAANYNDSVNDRFLSVENFVLAGGRAILMYYALEGSESLAAAFDASVVETLYSPLPVYDWGGSTLFAGLSHPLSFTDQFHLDGERLQPTAGAQAVAGFVSAATANQAALIIGNTNRTLLNGFALGEIASTAQAVQLAQNEIQFFLPQAPRIRVQPLTQAVKQGSNATFSVTVTGTALLSYQWHFNDTNLPGATQAALTVSNVTPAKAGPYFVVVSNVYGSVTSQVATLDILIPPVFTAHPQSQTVPAGTDVAFTVSVTGTLPISYRWRRGTTLTNMVLNENTCTLTLPSVLTGTAGVYTVVVTNLAGAASGAPQPGTSSNAYLTVVLPPTNQAIAVGSNATLSAQAYGGSGNTLRFQWCLDGTNLPGATSTNLMLSAVQITQAGTYSFVVTNGGGQATGFDAVLTVLAAEGPTINRCAQLASGGFQLQFDGASGASYTVLVSSNLMSWEVLGPATEAAPGSFEFTDLETPAQACRFYRLRCP